MPAHPRTVVERYAAGFDIGGTKCAVILGRISGSQKPEIIEKVRFSTGEYALPSDCIERLTSTLQIIRSKHPDCVPATLGISCGGPLDPVRGIIQSPPNLPGWDNIPITEIVSRKTGLAVRLQNDANACALAEWKFGAGKGTQNMIFLTFGTGLGAGIIANGQILNGASGMAGECGHIRLAPTGPIGYHKAGSFEGFCSGGGLAQQIRDAAEKAIDAGKPFAWCPKRSCLAFMNARIAAEAANTGDPDAIAMYAECGKRLGEGLAVLIDILNPERIVIGSIFARNENLLRPAMTEVLQKEALPGALNACEIVPAMLGEEIGDIAALAAGFDD
ncbi:MAG: ROK family protein [Oligosphaeraceae bacterium]|nr:ROK family protein [Oligosphaeraceae bacterium]